MIAEIPASADDHCMEAMRMTTTIHATTTPYEGTDFPEAADYATWAAGRLAEMFHGYEVTVEEGLRTRVQVRGVPDDRACELEREIATLIEVDLWNEFCEVGYRTIARFAVGDHVEGGDDAEDYDHGQVVAVDGDQVEVAWEQSQTRTTQSAERLRPYDKEAADLIIEQGGDRAGVR